MVSKAAVRSMEQSIQTLIASRERGTSVSILLTAVSVEWFDLKAVCTFGKSSFVSSKIEVGLRRFFSGILECTGRFEV